MFPSPSKLLCLSFSIALWWSFGASVYSAPNTDLYDGDPRQLLQSLFNDAGDIPSEDKQQISDMLEKVLGDDYGTIPYKDFSEFRRHALNEEIGTLIRQYPSGPYLTPLQRENKIAYFGRRLDFLFQCPVYPYQQTQELDGQIEAIADKIVDEVQRIYPEKVDLETAKMVHSMVMTNLYDTAHDDTHPALKYPMPAKELEEYLNSLTEQFQGTDPLNLNTHTQQKPAETEAKELEKDPTDPKNSTPSRMTNEIRAGLALVFIDIMKKYLVTVCRDHPENCQDRIPVDPEEDKRAKDLTMRARAEHREIRDREFKKVSAGNPHEELLIEMGLNSDGGNEPGLNDDGIELIQISTQTPLPTGTATALPTQAETPRAVPTITSPAQSKPPTSRSFPSVVVLLPGTAIVASLIVFLLMRHGKR